ncbi:hypothetical protein D3C83_78370 [compost metagenome]
MTSVGTERGAELHPPGVGIGDGRRARGDGLGVDRRMPLAGERLGVGAGDLLETLDHAAART